MPEFEIVTLGEAQARTAFVGRRARIIQEYLNYIQQLQRGQAGKLRAVGDEKVATVRRRLAQTAQALGTNLVIKRAGDEVYFWTEATNEERPRRTRRSRGQPRGQGSEGETGSAEVQHHSAPQNVQ